MPALLAKVSGVAGCLLLLASLAFHWFGVPDARALNGTLAIVTLEPRTTLFFKALCLAALVVTLGLRWREMSRPRLAAGLAAVFVALLFYPYFVMTWTPSIATQASWLNTQHENLSWLGGDIFNEQEYKDIDWKGHLYVSDAERQIGVFRLPNWSPQMIQWGRLGDLLDWLGYSNRFCQFVCRGWFAALAGSLLMLIPLSRGSEGLRYPVARAIGFTGFVTALAAVALALVPPLFSGWLMMRARHAVHQGDLSAGLRWLEWSAKILPAIRHDSGFVEQQGLLERALGRDTLEARLYAAILLERQGFAFQARARFEQLMDTAPPGGGVRREAVRALLRAGINELNSGAPGDALLTLERVLQAEPCNLKALYTIQLAGLRTARFDVVRPHAERMLAIYERFNTLTKAPEIAACHENLSYADFQSGDLNSALAQHTRAIGRK